jgi:hypothetical protein
MGQGRENPRAVARIRFATTCATVIHVPQHFLGIEHNLMAPLAFDVRDKTHATRVVLVVRVVETLLGGKRRKVFLMIHS